MPTAYNGTLIAPIISDQRLCRFKNDTRHESRSSISAEQANGGTRSLRIVGGGFHEIFYGCDAGSKTISIWVYPSAIGKCALQIFDHIELMGEQWNSGAGAWEQLSVTFVAVKKVYTIRLLNAALGGDTRAYFDDLI